MLLTSAGSRVLLAPGATVLGNIAIGTGVIINAVRQSMASEGERIVGCMQSNPRHFSLFLQCSVVVRPVPDFSRCSGVPAKVRIGTLYARYLIEGGLTQCGSSVM